MNRIKYLFLAMFSVLVIVPSGVSYAVVGSPEASVSSTPQVAATSRSANEANSIVTSEITSSDPKEQIRAVSEARKTIIDARKTEIADQKTALMAKKDALNSTKCAAVTSRIVLQITKFETKLQDRQTFFSQFSKRITNVIARFDENGYDTTKLKLDKLVLDQKIAQFASDKIAYIGLLKESQSYTCGKSEGEFRSKLIDAKEALNTARLSNLDVREYYQSIIRPDIIALKAQVKAVGTQE